MTTTAAILKINTWKYVIRLTRIINTLVPLLIKSDKTKTTTFKVYVGFPKGFSIFLLTVFAKKKQNEKKEKNKICAKFCPSLLCMHYCDAKTERKLVHSSYRSYMYVCIAHHIVYCIVFNSHFLQAFEHNIIDIKKNSKNF